MSDYEQEKWVEVYKSAVLELEQSHIAGRIANARAEIVKRIEALRNPPGLHEEERQAIEDAFNNLQFLGTRRRGDNSRRRAHGSTGRARTVAVDCTENQTA